MHRVAIAPVYGTDDQTDFKAAPKNEENDDNTENPAQDVMSPASVASPTLVIVATALATLANFFVVFH